MDDLRFDRARLRDRLAGPSPLDADQVAGLWADFLGRWSWDWFATLTFRPELAKPGERRPRSTHEERADKLFRVWTSKLNRELFGVRWYKRGQGVRWCRATEPHRNGRIHFHALLGAPELARVSRFAWMEAWEELGGGWARIHLPFSCFAVRVYCAKYVVKGGQLELGGPLGHGPVALPRASGALTTPPVPAWSLAAATLCELFGLEPANAGARQA